MKLFRHDGNQITVNALTLTLEEFLQHEPDYALPAGFVRREYIPGEKHLLFPELVVTGESVIEALPIPIVQSLTWTEGDGYIARSLQYQGTTAELVTRLRNSVIDLFIDREQQLVGELPIAQDELIEVLSNKEVRDALLKFSALRTAEKRMTFFYSSVLVGAVSSELLVYAMKRQRNQLLRASDWTQQPDSPLTVEDKQSWASYRQQLRDIVYDDPMSVTWPDQPQ